MTAQNPSNPFSLDGKVALVTGANTGLGQGIAIALAQAGADIVGVARSSTDGHRARRRARRAASFTRCMPTSSASTKPANVVGAGDRGRRARRHPGQQRRHHPPRRRARLQRGGLGRGDGRQPQVARSSWRRPSAQSHGRRQGAAARSSTSPRCCRSRAASAWRRTPRARAASPASRACSPTNGRRAASTSTRSRPGYFATNNTAALRADEQRNRDILGRIPAGRWGKPSDLGGAAVFLASAASDYVHGTILPVDGGWLARFRLRHSDAPCDL